MKKILLIPTLLTVASTPLISLVGCGDNKYKVTDQEMVDALSMKGIKYLQCNQTKMINYEGQVTKENLRDECSPNVYHGIKDKRSLGSYNESYVVYENDSYTQYSRTSPQQEIWDVETNVDEKEFITAKDTGEVMLAVYNLMIEQYKSEFIFTKADKSYTATVVLPTGATGEIKFYFEKKKLVKFEQITSNETVTNKNTISFTYDEYTPQPPTPEI